MMWDVQKLLGQLPQPVVTILRQATPTLLEQMTEIRLRSGQLFFILGVHICRSRCARRW